MRVAICAFVMLEVLATASSMNTERSQLRMVNRLTEANPKPKPDDRIEATNPTVINKKGIHVSKAEQKIAGTPADKVAVKDTVLKVTVAKKIAGSPVDQAKGAVKDAKGSLEWPKLAAKVAGASVGPKGTDQAVKKAAGLTKDQAVKKAAGLTNNVP